jgi:hypothetical protein
MAKTAQKKRPSRSALAPKLPEILRQALHPDDERQDSVDDILHGLKVLDAQREIATEADVFYDGELGMVWASEKVRQLLERQGVEDIKDFNYAAVPVDVIANRLEINSVVPAPAEENEDGHQAEEDAAVKAAKKAIAALRKDNQLDDEEEHLHLSASKHGQAFLLVWPVTDDAGNVVSVDMRMHDAHTMAMVYDPEDLLVAQYAIKAWDIEIGGQGCTRVNLYYFGEGKDGRIERWVTEGGSNPQSKDAWRPLVDAVEHIDEYDSSGESEAPDLAADEFTDDEDESGDDIPNPWGQIVFHFRNNRPIGIPEHRRAYGPQQMINKLIFAHAGTIDYQSFPQRYQLVDPMADDPLQNMADPMHPDDDDDDPETEVGGSGLRADPATVWRLYGKSVGEFQAADPQVFLGPLDRYVKSMAELTDTPQHAFSKASADMPSGDAVRELNGPMNTKVLNRRRRYGATWQDSYEKALEMMGIEGITVDVRWAPLEVVADAQGWEVVQLKINAGVPVEQALEETGYSSDMVEGWLKDATGADLGRRVALLNQIGTAVQTIGAGIALGAVSKEQAQAVITGVLKLTMEGSDVELPENPDDFVDPQAQQAAMLQAQQEHQQTLQQAQHQHATATQQAGHEFQAQQSEVSFQRMQEQMRQGRPIGGGPPGGQPRNGRPARPGQPPRGGQQ